MSIYEILTTLESNNSRNWKIEYLTKQQNNELLKRVIFLALDPFTQFYIRKIPVYVFNQAALNGKPERTLEEALNDLEELSSRKRTGHAGINWLADILESVSPSDAKVIERIIQKDLKCGVAACTVNKVWEDWIKEYPVMLATPFSQKVINKFHFPAESQIKSDGMRFNATVLTDGTITYNSRNGKELELFNEMKPDFITLAGGKDVVFDGELVVFRDGKMLDRKTGNGILNKAVKGTISKAEAGMVHAVIWDIIPYSHFKNDVIRLEYIKRLNVLRKKPWTDRVHLVKSTMIRSIQEAEELFKEALAAGEEGIIIKSHVGFWENRRPHHQIKFKSEKVCELRIKEIIEGDSDSKYVGMLGAFKCESEDGVIESKVGSGISDDQRVEFWNPKMVGKIISVKYNDRITAKDGSHSLFLPIFIEVREDKDIADTSENIK